MRTCQGSVSEREPVKCLQHPRKAAAAAGRQPAPPRVSQQAETNFFSAPETPPALLLHWLECLKSCFSYIFSLFSFCCWCTAFFFFLNLLSQRNSQHRSWQVLLDKLDLILVWKGSYWALLTEDTPAANNTATKIWYHCQSSSSHDDILKFQIFQEET